MGIFRSHRKQHNFSILDNSGAEDENLSLKGKGLLWYLLTKPDGWEVRNEHLMSALKIGREQLASAVRDLEETGYLIRIKYRVEAGKFDWIVEVFETPQDCENWKHQHQYLVDSALSGSTDRRAPKRKKTKSQSSAISGKPASGKPISGKPVPLLNTEVVKTDSDITDQENTFNTQACVIPQSGINASKEEALISQRENTHTKRDLQDPQIQEQPTATPTNSSPVNEKQDIDTHEQPSDRKGSYIPRFSLVEAKCSEDELAYDESGWLRLPTTKERKMPASIAIGRLQRVLAAGLLEGVVQVVLDGEDALQRSNGQTFVFDESGEADYENSAFKSPRLHIKRLLNRAINKLKATKEMLNNALRWLFDDSIAWCNTEGSNAKARIESEGLLLLFFLQDCQSFGIKPQVLQA